MKTRIAALAVGLPLFGALLAAMASLAAVTAPAQALAADTQEPGMCNGRHDANLVLTAHANGRPGDVPKFILNISTDASGTPTGSLVLDRGADRLIVTDWCRVWQHLPGQPPSGDCGETYPEGATTAHAVGVTTLRNGTKVLVRTDVRETDEGMFFRVRYKSLGMHEEATSEGSSCEDEDEGWTRVPTEEWYSLDQFKLRVTA